MGKAEFLKIRLLDLLSIRLRADSGCKAFSGLTHFRFDGEVSIVLMNLLMTLFTILKCLVNDLHALVGVRTPRRWGSVLWTVRLLLLRLQWHSVPFLFEKFLLSPIMFARRVGRLCPRLVSVCIILRTLCRLLHLVGRLTLVL